MKMMARTACLLLMVFVPGIFYGQSNTCKLVLEPGSKLWLEGDSTLHRYECEATVIDMENTIELKSVKSNEQNTNLLREVVSSPKILKYILKIPVIQMKSKTPGLSGEIHKRLKYKENPEIIFNLSSYESVLSKDKDNQFVIKSTGTLNVAGKENVYLIETTAKIEGDHIKLTGEKELDMTDFGLKRPVLLFVKADKKVLVKWELDLKVEVINKK